MDNGLGAEYQQPLMRLKMTAIDLHQAASTYDLFTASGGDVMLVGLTFRPRIAVGGGSGLTSISVQTDDTTNQVIISSTLGALANLTAENQLGWSGVMHIVSGTKIRFTINGNTAADDPTMVDVVAQYIPIVSGAKLL